MVGHRGSLPALLTARSTRWRSGRRGLAGTDPLRRFLPCTPSQTLMGPHAAMFELSVPCEVFGIHRAEIPGWAYRHVVCSPASETTVGQGGLTLRAEAGLEALDERTPSSCRRGSRRPVTRRRCGPSARRRRRAGWYPAEAVPETCSIDYAPRTIAARGWCRCAAGAFVLASRPASSTARRATTHWMFADVLAERFPAVEVDRSVPVRRGRRRLHRAGTAAGVDLCLHLVRRDLGVDAANIVARRMVVPRTATADRPSSSQTPVPAPRPTASNHSHRCSTGWSSTSTSR